jgi:hypothetical protein
MVVFQIMGHKMYGYLMADFLHGQSESSCRKKLKMKFTKAVILNQILTRNGEIYRRYPKKI